MNINKKPRTFISENLVIDSWESIQFFFEDLKNRSIENIVDFEKWLQDKSELDAVIEEDAAWRYIRMTIDTRNEDYTNSYTIFVTQIQPHISSYEDILNRKLIESSFSNDLSQDEAYAIYFRSVKKAIEIFRQENISIEAELNEKSQLFGSISAAQTIEHNGEIITMQKASSLLKENDEKLRQGVFEKMAIRRREDIEKLNILFDELIVKRDQLAKNADFKNYRDYKFIELGRFDYTKEDCFNFHQSIKKLVVPIVKEIQLEKLKKLNKTSFKPWDLEVDPDGFEPLKPFNNGSELVKGSLVMLSQIDNYFADCIALMDERGYLDLDSKEGKAPGGYNYPLYEIGIPFIFMNSVGTQKDLVTMVHESGHAVHSFLSRDLALTSFKNIPSEVAELASMSMEMLTMPYWNVFYKDKTAHSRAMKDQLESILKVLPWIAQIDEFQHWIYENPQHNHSERSEKWLRLSKDYGTGLTDWSGYEDIQATTWQRQLHLFEVPFYYIEYGIAQLGALGIWKNSLTNFSETIRSYKEALSLGYTRSIPAIYSTAGIKFDFTESYLKELTDFVKIELEKLNN